MVLRLGLGTSRIISTFVLNNIVHGSVCRPNATFAAQESDAFGSQGYLRTGALQLRRSPHTMSQHRCQEPVRRGLIVYDGACHSCCGIRGSTGRGGAQADTLSVQQRESGGSVVIVGVGHVETRAGGRNTRSGGCRDGGVANTRLSGCASRCAVRRRWLGSAGLRQLRRGCRRWQRRCCSRSNGRGWRRAHCWLCRRTVGHI